MLFEASDSAAAWCPHPTEGQQDWSVLARAPPSVVVDVGAFDGADTVAFARAKHAVHAFEPVPSSFRRVAARVRADGVHDRVTLHNLVVSNTSGRVDFWVHENGSQQDQFVKPRWKGGHAVSLRMDTLDRVLSTVPHVLFAKIDAQGHDPEVLRGARDLLASHRLQRVAFEVWPNEETSVARYVEVVRWLTELGYRCHDCTRPGSGQRPVPLREAVANLSAAKFVHRGALTSVWSDYVCESLQG